MAWAWELQQSQRGVISTLTHGLTHDAPASNGQSQAVTATVLIIQGLSLISQVIWKWVLQLRLSGNSHRGSLRRGYRIRWIVMLADTNLYNLCILFYFAF